MTDNTNTTAASGAASLGPLSDRAVKDAIRSAYDLGYNDARNARTVPGDSAPGYKGRDAERDHGGALIHALSQRLAAPAAQEAEPAIHPDDRAVDLFAAAMKDKMAAARAKGRGGWDTAECTQDRLSHMLREHVEKGDPRDVANFCMFLWARGEVIAAAPQAPAAEVADFPAVPNWLARLVGEYGVAGGRDPNMESCKAWSLLIRGINRWVRESIEADRAARSAPAPTAPTAAAEGGKTHG